MHAKVVPSSTFQLQQRSGEELTEANTQAVTKTPQRIIKLRTTGL